MKYLTATFAIAFMAFGFASITATSAQARSYDYTRDDCDGISNSEHGCRPHGTEITDVDPLVETAQGGDRDGDAGGGDFGGENDRAAASTAAE